MTRGALVLRPAPGDARTAARLEAAGVETVRLPLFRVVATEWTPPDPRDFDALFVTSANAVRHAGAGLATLGALPVVAVGEATAAAARAAGLSVVSTGARDAAAALAVARARGLGRLLHLAGRDHVATGLATVVTYASEVEVLPPGALAVAAGRIALLHSARAAARLAALVDREGVDRATVGIAALSGAVAVAAGYGWASVDVATIPSDAALVALVRERSIDPPGARGDKRA